MWWGPKESCSYLLAEKLEDWQVRELVPCNVPCYTGVSVGTQRLQDTAQAFLSVDVCKSGNAAILGGWCTVSLWLIAECPVRHQASRHCIQA